MDILLEQLQANLYPQIILQANINILERGESLFEVEVYGSLKKMQLKNDTRIEEFKLLVKDATDILSKYEISHLNQREIELSSLIFSRYFSMKSLIPGSIKYTERLRLVIFEEIQRYFIIHSTHILDPKFIIFLLNSSTNEFKAFCCKILYIVKDYFRTWTLKPSVREGIMGKLRSLFYKTRNKHLFHLLIDLNET